MTQDLAKLHHISEKQEQAYVRFAMRGAKRQAEILEPLDSIKLAVQRHADKLIVSWSGGRCSTTVLFMALKIDPNIKALFNTMGGAEFSETIKFVKRIAEEFKINLTIVVPERTIWDVFKQYGYPKPRRVSDLKMGIKASRTPACCRIIKEKPLIKAKKELGIEGELMGLRASEAQVRRMSTYQKGQYFFHKTNKIWRYNPIVFWTTRQLADYERENSIPINPIYLKYGLDRSGCWPCTGFRGWQEQMARVNPKFYAWITKRKGPQRILEHFYQSEIAPCSERG